MNVATETRVLLCIAGLMLLDATIGGAVASHVLMNLDERSLRSFDTAVEFEFFHALGLIGVVLVAERIGKSPWLRAAAWLLVAGVIVFCGSIGVVTFAAHLFRFGPLHADDLAVTIGAGVVLLVALELLKPLWRERAHR